LTHPTATAPTLRDLQREIERAIEIHGEDARWYGWDDGSIYISVGGDDVRKIKSEPFEDYL
jgi:hypothetical protein